ncbi:hypothetical protein [uncultured Pedobacter sp.]|uniref:hypothetical protein n=1 Tax=uncultured Pedobacter sp. TaxID=246139 RepID=UPI0025D8F474|nr:hypothetical protein [uncultured Pedobacter sp.]
MINKALKSFFSKSIFILGLIHLAYFIYGYFRFVGIGRIYIYTEFYRFKFYDDVSISHFFVSGLFLLTVLILLVRNHSKERYNMLNLVKIGAILLFMVFLSLSFFMSYSFGMNAKLKQELSAKNFNADKRLLNVLNPLLYPGSYYRSETLFKVTNILYPKPYPVTEVTDTVFYEPGNKAYYSVESAYYSIDTLKMLTSAYNKLKSAAHIAAELPGLDQQEFQKRILSKTISKDSTQIIFRGAAVNPRFDDSICVFLENNTLLSPVNGEAIAVQQRQSAINRYQLLYQLPHDSLLHAFQKLNLLLKKYQVESAIDPATLTRDVFRFRDQDREQLDQIRNNFNRNALVEKINILNRLFYQPNFFHPSIRAIFFIVLFSTWLFGFAIFIISTYLRKPKTRGFNQ